MYRNYNILENTKLTERELEVLQYVVKGLTNREIANILMVTHHTVKAHVASIIKKMGVRNRVEITVAAIERGLISNHLQDLKQPYMLPAELQHFRQISFVFYLFSVFQAICVFLKYHRRNISQVHSCALLLLLFLQ